MAPATPLGVLLQQRLPGLADQEADQLGRAATTAVATVVVADAFDPLPPDDPDQPDADWTADPARAALVEAVCNVGADLSRETNAASGYGLDYAPGGRMPVTSRLVMRYQAVWAPWADTTGMVG